MRRYAVPAAVATALLVVGLIGAQPAAAQQSFNFSFGGFVPNGATSRGGNDVLANNQNTLLFDMKDFNGATVNAEWLIGLGNHVEGGLGVGYYSRTSPAIYRDFTNADGSEIEQDLHLRIVPFSATVRFLPMGRRRGFQPYVGAGVGVLRYRYTESGSFIDFTDRSVFNEPSGFVGDGIATGPLIFGGFRFGGGPMDFGFEVRHQAGKGDLPTVPPEGPFAGSQIDLGGMNYVATINMRF